MDDDSLWDGGKLGGREFSADSSESLDRKVRTLAQWMAQARHVVFFTGSEISHPAGLFDTTTAPRYRGPRTSVQEASAVPTRAHMAIKTLLDEGTIQYLITTTTDNLHRKAETSSSRMCELHGNLF
eukprot:TRINITY_DN23472_c0_g1_i2.p1 TRINITY_DN23472_c0_g1~~TRINITY_DN23472_c0_g1_i2.p1  ORF type:complete len:126 (-),score=28.69 TRINITY_DN23472_c0_g1_i2:165-542(-)